VRENASGGHTFSFSYIVDADIDVQTCHIKIFLNTVEHEFVEARLWSSKDSGRGVETSTYINFHQIERNDTIGIRCFAALVGVTMDASVFFGWFGAISYFQISN